MREGSGVRYPLAMRCRLKLLLLLLLPVSCSGGDGAGEGFNVVLISLDSTRRDLLSAYGHAAPHAPDVASSPRLDALAAEGVLFREAYATTSWTLPSHMTLMTGVPELVHGVEIDYLRPDPSRTTLAEALRGRGYRTAGFYSGPYLEPRFGFGRGFDRYESGYGPDLAAATRRFTEAHTGGDQDAARAASLEVESMSHKDVSAASIVDAAIAEIEAASGEQRPFFLFAHFFDPHYDYLPPEPHASTFDPSYAGAVDGHDFWVNPAISIIDSRLPSGRQRVADERDLEHVRALYAGELAWTDAQVGRLLDALERVGAAENTLVIVTSDHGDEFFEHDGLGHRRTLYEESVRIPMILRMPGVLPAGSEVDGLVSNEDVFATIFELLDLPAVPTVLGASMVPLIEGDRAEQRSVIGRLVTSSPVTLQAPTPSGAVQARGQLITIEETYRKGSIKITRRRRWPEVDGRPPAGAGEALRANRDRERARETLTWIDVARYPDEPPGAESSNFAGGPARAALQEFHDRYVDLSARRAKARLPGNEPPMPDMSGLGYVTGSPAGDEVDEIFRLPPPGEALLNG